MTNRFTQGNFTFETEQGWESLFMLSSPVYETIARETGLLAGELIKEAPRGPHVTTEEYAVKNNIHPVVEAVDGEWVGYITVEENPQARHAMLQERGYTGRDGTRHAGRRYIQRTLERNRVE
ncbi:hypothetical protein ACFQ71_03045 [Streptomyces sp. NPDC056534]|uniref:hypothetical protein n=1 Tax=Streptomyces sp. NPDC056534 TaxID=3345857 RepID=UPI00368C7547